MWVRCRFEVSITCLPIFCLHAALNIGDQNEIYSPDLFLQATTPATQQQWRSEAIRAVVAAFAVVIEEEDRLEGEAEVIQVSAHNACLRPNETDRLRFAGRGGFQPQSFGPPAQVFGVFEYLDAVSV